MTYLFSLKIYRIFFPSSLPAPSILKFCYEVPYIHNWVYHSTWKLISLKFWEILLNYFADDCFSVILSHDTHFLFFLKLLLFRCQIFRITFKPTFLSSFCSTFWDFLNFTFQLLYWVFHLSLFLVSRSSFVFQCFFYDILLLCNECNIFYFFYLRLLILFFPLFSICFGFCCRKGFLTKT